jgi:hypothetical protein
MFQRKLCTQRSLRLRRPTVSQCRRK